MKTRNFTGVERKDVYQVITDRIIGLIEEGVNPWRKTWKNDGTTDFSGPKNYISGKPYRGINFFVLSCTNFNSPYFMTMKQANDKGGMIKKGEKSTPVVFAKTYQYKETKEENGEKREVAKTGFCYKMYYVFNIEQTTLPVPAIVEPVEEENKNAKIESCEAIFKGYKNAPSLKHGGSSAHYRPSSDIVQMPVMDCFNSSDEYYATLFHELIHSTGHSKRLEREGIINFDRFGSERYSKEELVAEMGAAFLNCVAGISSVSLENNSAAYIKGWLKPLKSDKKFIFKAASAAQKAVTHIIGEPKEEEAEN